MAKNRLTLGLELDSLFIREALPIVTISESRHLREIQHNRQVWQRKPALQRAYAALYANIRDNLCSLDGMTLELGSGLGAIKQFIPECITSDIFPNPWLERVENAYQLSFADASISNLILFDVFHHLEWPGTAFKEFSRVVREGGRLILMEPGLGLLGRFIYENFHDEPLGLGQPIVWDRPSALANTGGRYYAAQGNAWRIFVNGQDAGRISGWRSVLIRKLSALSYVASGGFTRPAFYPSGFFPLMHLADRLTAFLPSIFTTRLMVVLERSRK